MKNVLPLFTTALLMAGAMACHVGETSRGTSGEATTGHAGEPHEMATGEVAEAALQTVDEIIERHVEAIGGAGALAGVGSLRAVGRYEFTGVEHPMTILRRRPSDLRVEIVIEGKRVVSATDGRTAWQLDEFRSEHPEPMTEDAAARFIEELADFDGPLVNYRTKAHRVALVGRADVDGSDTYHLKVMFESGRTQDWFLDSRSFIPVKSVTMGHHDRRGDYPRFWYYLDYRPVDGLLFPHSFEREDYQMVRTYTLDTIELNPELADDLFQPPATGEAQR